MSILLGAIADDFTGATDLASTLLRNNMRAVQVNGVPESGVPLGDAEAVVVALKTRTAPARQAVSESLMALRWLRRLGAEQFFFKYCSTFDSTAAGNIGPVADALLDELDAPFAIVCPAFPKNRRTVYMGHLFVGDQPLSESPMKDHPLTPMRDSDLVRLMGAQTPHRVGLVPYPVVRSGRGGIVSAYDGLISQDCRYGVVDALVDTDLDAIGASVAGHPLVTGGSGIARGLPGNLRRLGPPGEGLHPTLPSATGRRIVLAGSCSERTREQIRFVTGRWPARKVEIRDIHAGNDYVEELVSWLAGQDGELPVLLYTSSDPREVRENQRIHGREQAGEWLEGVMGTMAVRAVELGFRRIVVAGGETAGAVVNALNVRAMRICAEIDPGVPWTETLDSPPIALALKSGNFGGADFFEKSFSLLP